MSVNTQPKVIPLEPTPQSAAIVPLKAAAPQAAPIVAKRAPVHRLLRIPHALRLELGGQVAAARLHAGQRGDAVEFHHHHAHLPSLGATSTRFLNTSRDSDSTTSLDHLCQCLTTL